MAHLDDRHLHFIGDEQKAATQQYVYMLEYKGLEMLAWW